MLISIILSLIEDKLYEVVLTTYDGLYRYRTQDIITVTGHYYTLPTWQIVGRFVCSKGGIDWVLFSFRRGQYLSISSEHVTEIELREIIDVILSKYEQDFTSTAPQYLVFIDKTSYALSIEVDDDKQENQDRLKQIGKEICSKFDQKLQADLEEYRKFRANKKISPPILLWLKNNTLTTGTRDFRLNPNRSGGEQSKARSSNQLKSQLILKKNDKDVIQFVKGHIVLKID
jgi:hypothetical protein